MDILFPMLFNQDMYKDFDTLPSGAHANNHPNSLFQWAQLLGNNNNNKRIFKANRFALISLIFLLPSCTS